MCCRRCALSYAVLTVSCSSACALSENSSVVSWLRSKVQHSACGMHVWSFARVLAASSCGVERTCAAAVAASLPAEQWLTQLSTYSSITVIQQLAKLAVLPLCCPCWPIPTDLEYAVPAWRCFTAQPPAAAAQEAAAPGRAAPAAARQPANHSCTGSSSGRHGAAGCARTAGVGTAGELLHFCWQLLLFACCTLPL